MAELAAHAHHDVNVAHQFDDAEQQKESVTVGMWAFLVNEVMFFGGLFGLYIVYRFLYPTAFQHASHHLDVTLGTFNTAVLIGSSLTMALAVHAAQMSHNRFRQIFWVMATVVLGSVFLGVKVYEYYHKWVDQLIPGPNFHWPNAGEAHAVQIFYSLYFAMTGLHALHMVIGVGIMAWLMWAMWKGRFGPAYHNPVEVCGLYWHFVDIVWIFLFPLLYLIGRH